ncbi:hypothetical protein B0H14DRAFT_2723450, partial [Mycena olivaceomarginata]
IQTNLFSLAAYSSIEMVANITIIVVFGSRKMAERLLTSHDSAVVSTETGTLFHKGQAAKVKIQLVSVLHASGTPLRLDEIERKVSDEIEKTEGTTFLGLSGKGLFEKLTVVPLTPRPPSVVLPKALFSFAKGEDAGRIQLRDIYSKAAESSKTINRLIGKELLDVGRGTLGSTTKVIERVQVRNTSKDLSSDITVALDDTPGLEDNTFEDRELNASLLLRYKADHFTNIYPNVIALRANIVVVVTKSLSSFHQFDDYKTMKEKHAQWRIEEGRRRGIITDLQRKMFARSSAWEIVFVENGGGKDMTAKLPVLPDGLLSHQNLYDAICNIIKRPSSDGSLDLVGIQALQVLTGAGPLSSLAEARTEVLVTSKEIFKIEENTEKPPPLSSRQILEDLASNYLGMTYDNVTGTFGYTNVLEEQKINLRVVEERKDLDEITNPLTPHPQSDEPENDRRRRHYSSDWAFRAAVAAVSKNSQCHILHSARVVVSKPKYMQFFKNYGTHVITQLVLGGTVRAIVDSTNNPRNPNVMIFRDGGASVAAELTMCLEQHFPRSASSSGWKETREKWIQALEKEPVFCPDHELTQYKPIYELGHLTSAQRADLASAYREYVASPSQNDKNSDRRASHTGSDSDWLQRDHNFAEAVKDLLAAVTQALYRLWQGR